MKPVMFDGAALLLRCPRHRRRACAPGSRRGRKATTQPRSRSGAARRQGRCRRRLQPRPGLSARQGRAARPRPARRHISSRRRARAMSTPRPRWACCCSRTAIAPARCAGCDQAADAGEPRAMLLYGTALFNGDGVARDPVRAYAYVSRAAAQGLVAATRRCRHGRDDAARRSARRASRWPRRWSRRKAAPRSRSSRRPSRRRRQASPTPPRPQSAAASQSPAAAGASSLARSASARPPRPCSPRLRGKVGARQAYYVPAGKVVRLQVGPYESRAAAAAACAALGGQACFPVAAR